MRAGAVFLRFGYCRGRYAAMTYVPRYCTTVLVLGRKLREQDAGVVVVLNAARPEREDSKDSLGRQPLTSDSQAFVPEVTILHHPLGVPQTSVQDKSEV